MAEKNIDYKDSLSTRHGLDSASRLALEQALAGSLTEDEARWRLQKHLFGLDRDGRVNPPLRDDEAVWTEGWPKREKHVYAPTAADVLSNVGIKISKEDGGEGAIKEFIKLYKSKPDREDMEERLAKENPRIGKGYAKQVLQLTFRQAVKDNEAIELQKARDDAMSMKWNEPYSWYASLMGHTLLRNMYNAGLEGRDPTLADIGSDAAEAALFAVPGGQYAKAMQLTRLGALGKGGKYAARILGESVAPFANEGVQFGLHSIDGLEESGVNPYDDDTFHDQERTTEATFSPERAAMGALTNNAVGIGMYRQGSKMSPVLTGELTRGANSKALRQGVQGAETAGDVVRQAEEVARNVKGFKSEDGLNSFLAGNAKGLDKAAMSDAEGVLRFKAKAKDLKVPENVPSYVDNFDGYVEAILDHNGIVGGERELFKRTLTAHPQLATLIKSDSKMVKARRAWDLTTGNTGAARSEVVNKYGSQKDANLASSMLGLGKLDDLMENQAERELNNRRAVENENLRARQDLDDTDRKYIEQVIKNPKMLQFSNDTGFKLWLVTRGNDILRGTSYHRPTWDTEE